MDLFDAMKSRKIAKHFKPNPVSEDSLKRIFNAARLAPSVDNLQPWKVIAVRDEDLKKKVAAACGTKAMAEAPVILVACGMPDDAYPFVGGYLNAYPMDVSAMLSHMLLAATAEGLCALLVHTFKEEQVAEALAIPPDAKVVGVMPIGYGEGETERLEGKNVSDLVSYDHF
jgi:nitroreductase